VQVLLSRINALVFLDTPDVIPDLSSATFPIEVGKPSPTEQREAWSAALGDQAGDAPAMLVGHFDLGLPSIREIARQALADAKPEELQDRLWTTALNSTRARLDELAQHLEPKAKWDDIVLPPAEMKLLTQIADQVGYRSMVYDEWGFRDKSSRGLGINALFAGESGTGKTMAAEVLANHLGLNLHRIDLSAVVSKYIGQTEKNLRRLFDAADNGGAVLFFDEADALFGKRSEVKDSHDRYANIEINFLLQRMESYRGLAILATNMKSALDPAFLRRLRFIVTFPFPGVAERKAIWQKVFPPQAPVSALDYDRLAKLNVTGGHIHNIAMNAAFLAAHSGGGSVTMPMILDAARAEFRKLERPINEADFRWQGAA
jgi:SpoVK/Ycf46/Vps4 family AAA+-type ATPase